MAACKQSGVSTAAIALAIATQTQFIPLQIQAGGVAPSNIQIELQRADTIIRVQLPIGCAAECAAWMREVLK